VIIDHRRLVPGDHVLRGHLDLRRRAIDLITDVIGMGVVDRNADLILAARGSGFPRLGVEREDDGRVLAHAVGVGAELFRIDDPFAKAVLRRLGVQLADPDAHSQARVDRVSLAFGAFELSVALEDVLEHPAVRPDAVRRVAGVLLTLQPVTVEHVDRDLPNAVRPHVQIPARKRRSRQRAHVREDQAAEFLHRIPREPATHLALRLRLQRPLQTRAGGTEEPAVIRTAQPALVRDPELEIDAAVKTPVADEAEAAAFVAYKTRSSPRMRTFPTGFSSNCAYGAIGIQYRRIRSPQGVPGPTRVSLAFISAVIIQALLQSGACSHFAKYRVRVEACQDRCMKGKSQVLAVASARKRCAASA
jgi:hypothetical protein